MSRSRIIKISKSVQISKLSSHTWIRCPWTIFKLFIQHSICLSLYYYMYLQLRTEFLKPHLVIIVWACFSVLTKLLTSLLLILKMEYDILNSYTFHFKIQKIKFVLPLAHTEAILYAYQLLYLICIRLSYCMKTT